MSIALIWAEARGGVIGHDGSIPWHLPEDLAHFKELTTGTAGSAVLMGRRTWDSLPERFRPLPGRRNLVLTRSAKWSSAGAEVVHSVEEAVAAAGATASTRGSRTASARGGAAESPDLWVIGGGDVYRHALASASRLEVTELDLGVRGDTLAPTIDGTWVRVTESPWLESKTGIRYRFVSYGR